MIRGSRRVAPAVPLSSSRAANLGRTTLQKACPLTHTTEVQSGLEVRTKSARLAARKPGSFPRLCWPHFRLADLLDAGGQGLSLGFRFGTGSLGQVGPPFPAGLRATTLAMDHRSCSFLKSRQG